MVDKIVVGSNNKSNYNPYDLLELSIGGTKIFGRPFAFDSDIVNQKTMHNAFGQIVKPTKVSTICPKCSNGLEIELDLDSPPFGVIECLCKYCSPAPPPIINPFINPLSSGRVSKIDLDPMLHDLNKPLLDETPIVVMIPTTNTEPTMPVKKQVAELKLEKTINTKRPAKKTTTPIAQPVVQHGPELLTELDEEQDLD